MPSVSESQRRAMFSAAAGHSTLGIPKSVGEEFANSDPGGKLPEHKPAKDMERSAFRKLGELLTNFFKEEANEPEHGEDDWSPEARAAAAEARRKNAGHHKAEAQRHITTSHQVSNEQHSRLHREASRAHETARHHHETEEPEAESASKRARAASEKADRYEQKSARERARDERNSGAPIAASVAFVTPEGKVLLVKRSEEEQNFPGHWGLPGGRADDGEDAEACARREATEEIGDCTFDGIKPLNQVRTERGWDHTTFVVPVKDEFEPKLNGEHSEYAWHFPDDLPDPVHPGVKATFDKAMASDDYQPKVALSPLLKRSAALADVTPAQEKLQKGFRVEPSHALDAMAMDKSSVRSYDTDGRLHVGKSNISRATVNPYYGREIPDYEKHGLDPDKEYQLLRHPDELKKATPTFNNLPLLSKHVPVTADSHQPNLVVGSTGTDANFDGDNLTNSLVIWSKDAIDDVENDDKSALSCAYKYRYDPTPGEFDGKHYDGIMRDLEANHLALVPEGRVAGAVVGDASDDFGWATLELALKRWA